VKRTTIGGRALIAAAGAWLSIGGAAPALGYAAVSAPFAPPAPFFGLDAMSYFK
jgi:hypothetical protein